MPSALSHRPERGSLLTIAGAAAYLQLNEKTVRRLVADGKVPGFFVTPRALRVRATDLDAYLESVSTARFGGA